MEQVRTLNGGLNTDDSVEILDPNDYQFAANFMSGRSTMNQNGGKELLKGTTVISTGALTDANSKCIGVMRTIKDNIHFLFFYNTVAAKNCILIMTNDVVTNMITWSGLNFSPNKDHRINGGGVVVLADGSYLVFFTDNYNEQRCVHSTRYAVTPPVSEEEILVIKRAPLFPLSFKKTNAYGTPHSNTLWNISSTTSSTVVGVFSSPVNVPLSGVIILEADGREFSYTGYSVTLNVLGTFILNFSGVSPAPSGVTGTFKVHDNIDSSIINDFSFQFAYYYRYIDNQKSVLSPYSALCAKSVESESYRGVKLTLPTEESIPELVDELVLCARLGNIGSFFEVGKLTTSQTIFTFLNSTNGNVIDPFLTQPFSLVPRRSGSMALSKSRLWVGNYLEGYNSPSSIDMSASINTVGYGANSLFTVYTLLKRTYTWDEDTSRYLMSSTGSVFFDTSYKYLIIRGDNFDVLNILDIETYDISGAPLTRRVGFTDLLKSTYVSGAPNVGNYPYDVYTWVAYDPAGSATTKSVYVTFAPALSTYVGTKSFPADSSYKLGIIFGDNQGRKCGVYTDDDLIVNIPNESFISTSITWGLNSNAGIPTWADNYSIVLTKNLKKSWFLDTYSVKCDYAKQNTAGVWVYANGVGSGAAFSKNYTHVRVDIRNLKYNDLSYSYIAGDKITLRGLGYAPDSDDVTLDIESFDGSYLLCKRGDCSYDMRAIDMITYIEIFRPITTGGADYLFYEIGQVYKLYNNAGTLEFTATSGVIEGDSVVESQDLYEITAGEIGVSVNDRGFKRPSVDVNGFWNTDIGRAYIETPVGEVLKESYTRHSSTYIGGTEINGLCDFDSGDEGNIPIESGAIQKLQPTSKESTEGDILLAIASSDTFSIYIDETRMTAGTGSFLIGATKVIGDIRKQKSGFGTVHPEGVHEEDGYVFFYDKITRAFCRYASNGIYPISENKVSSHFETQSLLNSEDDRVITGYDPFYKVIFCTFTNANVSTPERKTIGFSLLKERWIGFFDFAPDQYFTGSEAMYSIKNGTIYKHNDTVNYNRFYGVDYDAKISASFNDMPDKPKDWKVVGIDCSPNLLEFVDGNQVVVANGLKADISNENGQATDILYNEFDGGENSVYGEIRGDLNTGTVLTGDAIYSNTLQVKVTAKYGANKYILFLKAGYELSTGHTL